jgi:hypothetical protein
VGCFAYPLGFPTACREQREWGPRRVAIFVVVAALVGAKAAWSAIFVGADNPAFTAVVGGFHRDLGACFYLLDGTRTFCSARALDISVDAHGLGTGGPATGTFLSGTNGDTNGLRARVTCMTVIGNRAVVGGLITDDPSNPTFVGYGLQFYVIDNGDPGNNPTRDKVSGNEISSPDEFAPGFPQHCGAPISTFTGYTDLLAGDVSIHSGL